MTAGRSLGAALLFLAAVTVAACSGILWPPGAWYAALAKPPFTPPPWVFGPVWTALYLMIAAAGWLVWRAGAPGRKALALWGVQMALNALWTPVFFGAHAPLLGLVVIVTLWGTILAFLSAARRASRWAALLFVPYLLWVGFASALNAALWWLNRAP